MTNTTAVVKGFLTATIVAAAALAAPAAATAAPAASVAAGNCPVQTAEMTWGVKESFRSYISGSIANGEWTVSEDMRYETPNFIWNQATGSVSETLDEGRIAFTGAVHFTGHDGAMQLDIANPAIEFAGEDTAYLMLTMGATDTANAGGAASASEVRAAKIDLGGAVSAQDGDLKIVSAPARLTAEGAEAFNGEYGSYVSGDELDPVNVTATVDCLLAASSVEALAEPAPAEVAAPQQAAAPSVPWVPIVIAGVAVLVIGVTVGMLIAGRGKKQPTAEPGTDDASSTEV